MANPKSTLKFLAPAMAASMLLAACGGGGGSNTNSSTGATTVGSNSANALTSASTSSMSAPLDTANGPAVTGNTATDGLAWINYRRQSLGESTLLRTTAIDTAAQSHSRYQQLNNTITHEEVKGNTGFTGVAVGDRLTAAGYVFKQQSYAYGEVISSTVDPSGFTAAEELITAIYHRFAIFEPMFRQAGAGSAVSSAGRTYFTVDFTTDGLPPALGKGNFVVYPMDRQTNLPVIFYSDYESPDPVPNQNESGYPVSVHADITSSVTVQSFTIRPRNGAAMPTVLLQSSTDPHTPGSSAAIVPLAVLARATTYDVQFTGTVDGVAANRSWSFTTR